MVPMLQVYVCLILRTTILRLQVLSGSQGLTCLFGSATTSQSATLTAQSSIPGKASGTENSEGCDDG